MSPGHGASVYFPKECAANPDGSFVYFVGGSTSKSYLRKIDTSTREVTTLCYRPEPISEVLTGATSLLVVPSDHAGPAAHGLDNVALGSMFVMLGALMLSRRATRSDYSLVRRASDYSWPHPARILLARILPADVPSHAHYGTRPAAGTHAHLSRHRCDRIFAVCTCVCLCASCSSGFRQ